MTQIDFPFTCDASKLEAFLIQWWTLEHDEDLAREAKRLLQETYRGAIPMRATLAALKVVRTQRKLAQHPKEPMSRVHQTFLEHAVEEYLMEVEEQIAMIMVPMAREPLTTWDPMGFRHVAETDA